MSRQWNRNIKLMERSKKVRSQEAHERLHSFMPGLNLAPRMSMYRSFIFPEAELSEDRVVLDSRESHHLVRVFRARAGEAVELLDGRGNRYLGALSAVDSRAAVVDIKEVRSVPPLATGVTLLQSLPKGKAMDLILRIATEIGVSTVAPVFTARGEVQLKGDRMENKLEKWRLTMVESCKQCGLPFLPELSAPLLLDDYLRTKTLSPGEIRLVASLEKGARPLIDAFESYESPAQVTVAVGPEGDFSHSEYEALRSNGFQPVRLGANVLRAETAAAYILSVVDQRLRGHPSN